MNTTQESQQRDTAAPVRIVDVHMPFGSMVTFMVKWAVAAIPAILILTAVGVTGSAFLAGLVGSFHK
jgi:hypothetical protein